MASIEELLNEVVVAPKVKATTTTEESNIESLLNEVVPQATPEQIEKQTKEKEREEQLDRISTFKKFNYGLDKSDNILTNTSLYLESKFPMGVFGRNGKFYTSPDELYGEGFTDLSEDERRAVLIKHRQEELKQEYPILSVLSKEGSTGFAETLGSAAKILVDPTILFPVGQTVGRAIGSGMAVGGLYSATEDLASVEGKINKEKLAVTSAFAGTASGLISKGVKILKNKKALKREEIQEADIKMVDINKTISEGVAKNVKREDLPKYVSDELSLPPEDVSKAIARSSIPLNTPATSSAKLENELFKVHKNHSQGNLGLFMDGFLGVVSTRLANISKPIALALNNFERKIAGKTSEWINTTEPFLKAVNKESKETQARVNLHLANGEYGAVIKILENKTPNIKDEVVKVRNLLNTVQKEFKEVNYKFDEVPNYFPRKIKDMKGLKDSLNSELKGVFSKALYKQTRDLGLESVDQLPEEVVAKTFNDLLKGNKGGGFAGLKSVTQKRQIEKLDESMIKFYEKPSTALTTYLRQAANDIEKRKFLGRTKKEEGFSENLQESVGDYVDKELRLGRIKAEDAEQVKSILTSRFGLGEKSPNKFIRSVRDIGYGVTLGNPVSALVQLGDIGTAAYTQGLGNTLAAILSKKKVNIKDFGIDDLMAHELNNAVDTSALLGKVLSLSGFRAADRYGKNVLMNAAYKKATNLVKEPKGIKAFAKKNKEAFGKEEFDLLVKELQSGQVTDRVKLYLWNELSNVQPISMAQVPQAYLNKPDGRIFYALKSFTIKQLDLIRRSVIQEYKAGNKIKAGRNFLAYSLLVAGLNGTVKETKDWMLGKGFSPEEISDNSFEHLWSLIFASQYVQERYLKQGDIEGYLTNAFMPPISLLSDVAKDGKDLIVEGDVLPERTIKNLPVAGKLWYNFFGGGLENSLERQEARRREDD